MPNSLIRLCGGFNAPNTFEWFSDFNFQLFFPHFNIALFISFAWNSTQMKWFIPIWISYFRLCAKLAQPNRNACMRTGKKMDPSIFRSITFQISISSGKTTSISDCWLKPNIPLYLVSPLVWMVGWIWICWFDECFDFVFLIAPTGWIQNSMIIRIGIIWKIDGTNFFLTWYVFDCQRQSTRWRKRVQVIHHLCHSRWLK